MHIYTCKLKKYSELNLTLGILCHFPFDLKKTLNVFKFIDEKENNNKHEFFLTL
jgi:hypothetical protein